jgi:hypothetical protein
MLLLAPLLATVGCTGPCGDVSPVSNASQGTFTYVESNAPSRGHTTTNGGLSGGLEISTNMDGAFAVEGVITDASGQEHDVTLSIVGASQGSSMSLGSGSTLVIADCAPGDSDGSCNYINQTTVPLSGTLSTDSFSTDCHAAEGCALSVIGTLSVSASWGDASLTANIMLNYQSVWQSIACSTSGSSDSS